MHFEVCRKRRPFSNPGHAKAHQPTMFVYFARRKTSRGRCKRCAEINATYSIRPPLRSASCQPALEAIPKTYSYSPKSYALI